MKRFLIAATITAFTSPVLASGVGMSIHIEQPGFYGSIDMVDAPPPLVIYSRPVVVEPGPVYLEQQPIYVYVPPFQMRHWRKYCHSYRACGRPVYFVQESWYDEVYAPRHHRHEGGDWDDD